MRGSLKRAWLDWVHITTVVHLFDRKTYEIEQFASSLVDITEEFSLPEIEKG